MFLLIYIFICLLFFYFCCIFIILPAFHRNQSAFYNDCLLCAGRCGAAVGHYNDTCVLAVAGERGSALPADPDGASGGCCVQNQRPCRCRDRYLPFPEPWRWQRPCGLPAGIRGDMLNHIVGLFVTGHPFFKNFCAQSLFREGQPREYSRRPLPHALRCPETFEPGKD